MRIARRLVLLGALSLTCGCSYQSYQSDFAGAAVESRLGAAIVGSDATVKAGLEKLVADTGADEIIAVTDTWDHESRLDSYHRLAGVAASIEMKILTTTNPNRR